MTRVLTALALLPLAAIAVWAPFWVFASLCGVGLLLGLREFWRMSEAAGVPPLRWSGLAAGLGALLPAVFRLEGVGYGGLVALAAGLAVFEAIVRRIPAERAVHSVAWTLYGAVLLGMFLASQLLLRAVGGPAEPGTGGRVLLYLYATVFAGDSAAYYLGTRFGRSRMAPHLSPKKSWEGFGAGMAACALVGAVCGRFLVPGLGAVAGGATGLALGVAAAAGDLAESMLKRSAGVKDSGRSLPGHGGLWDRFDSLIFSSPLLLEFLHLGIGAQGGGGHP